MEIGRFFSSEIDSAFVNAHVVNEVFVSVFNLEDTNGEFPGIESALLKLVYSFRSE